MKADSLRRAQVVLLMAALGASMGAGAHHSVAAEFDSSKPITITGTVQKVMWMNPHIYTHVAVKGADGQTSVYRIEGGTPNALFRQGWRKDTLKAGDVVSVSGTRAKNPESMNIGQATITTAAGRKIFAGSAVVSGSAAAP